MVVIPWVVAIELVGVKPPSGAVLSLEYFEGNSQRGEDHGSIKATGTGTQDAHNGFHIVARLLCGVDGNVDRTRRLGLSHSSWGNRSGMTRRI